MAHKHPYHCKECGTKIYYSGNNTWWCPRCKKHKNHIKFLQKRESASTPDEVLRRGRLLLRGEDEEI